MGRSLVESSRSVVEGAAVHLDEETRAAIARLRFSEPGEQHFREGHLALNLPRARSATAMGRTKGRWGGHRGVRYGPASNGVKNGGARPFVPS